MVGGVDGPSLSEEAHLDVGLDFALERRDEAVPVHGGADLLPGLDVSSIEFEFYRGDVGSVAWKGEVEPQLDSSPLHCPVPSIRTPWSAHFLSFELPNGLQKYISPSKGARTTRPFSHFMSIPSMISPLYLNISPCVSSGKVPYLIDR